MHQVLHIKIKLSFCFYGAWILFVSVASMRKHWQWGVIARCWPIWQNLSESLSATTHWVRFFSHLYVGVRPSIPKTLADEVVDSLNEDNIIFNRRGQLLYYMISRTGHLRTALTSCQPSVRTKVYHMRTFNNLSSISLRFTFSIHTFSFHLQYIRPQPPSLAHYCLWSQLAPRFFLFYANWACRVSSQFYWYLSYCHAVFMLIFCCFHLAIYDIKCTNFPKENLRG